MKTKIQRALISVFDKTGVADFAKALAEAGKVLKLKPDLLPAARFHAMLLARADRFDEAVAELEQLCRHDPKDLASRAVVLEIYFDGAKTRP
ncbi:hypothetical protein LCGC14_2977770 [marine sediment metagenome]|uniref:Uncharacterized protein n=1 Tax=marine sediment metagenome TaxID=412755 RepID=A0A0F8ZF18_9ZZZZ